MKRSIIIAFAFLISMTSLLAQNMDNPKVQKLRKEFYSEKLQFSDAENKNFWPLFEKYQLEENKLDKKCNTSPIGIPDPKLPDHIKEKFECEEQKLALKKQYTNQYMEVLPARKVAMLDEVERQFKQDLLKKIRQNRQGNRQN